MKGGKEADAENAVESTLQLCFTIENVSSDQLYLRTELTHSRLGIQQPWIFGALEKLERALVDIQTHVLSWWASKAQHVVVQGGAAADIEDAVTANVGELRQPELGYFRIVGVLAMDQGVIVADVFVGRFSVHGRSPASGARRPPDPNGRGGWDRFSAHAG